jgi:putative DNA primase/helicase
LRRTTEAENRRYLEDRFRGQRIGTTRELRVKCPFHDDRTPSMSWSLEKAAWKCHAGCGEGGLVDFEVKLNGGTREAAWHRVTEVMGAQDLFEAHNAKPVAVYAYHDAQGRLVFEKLRYEPKRFVLRKPDGKGGHEYSLGNVLKPLYRLPEVITANVVFVCEGEKDADRVSSLELSKLDPNLRAAATTNFEGAGRWRGEYAPYFAGKRVVVLPDNDEPGRQHAEAVARSVAKYAAGVRVVSLSGLPEKGDVSDYLDAHTAQDLAAEIKKAPAWSSPASAHRMFVEAVKFTASTPTTTRFVVDGVIQEGGNGAVIGEPKAGKSLVMLDLVIAVSTGTPWLGKKTERKKTALISREDYPGMTAQRLQNLFRGAARALDFEGWCWINTRQQTPTFLLEDDAQVSCLIDELRAERVEFACFDVFRKLHTAEENDNTEMQVILNQLSKIQNEVGCALAVVHHTNNSDRGSIFRRIRGATAIHGWTEWAVGVSVVNPEEKPREWIRKVEFETKAACPADPVYFQIEAGADTLHLRSCEPRDAAGPRPVRNAASFMKGAQA